jgi:hypothetical protein
MFPERLLHSGRGVGAGCVRDPNLHLGDNFLICELNGVND